jgi:histidinol-phosphate aminotransferase
MLKHFLDLATPGVRGLKPYQPGKPISELEREYGVSGIVKLASNENPLGPSPQAVEAITAALGDLGLYPDANGFDLKARLARRHGVGPECITLGNGSNDVLVLLAEAFLRPDLAAVFSQYAFAVYPIATQAAGAESRIAPAIAPDLPGAYGHDLDAMVGLLDDRTRLVFIANPNNPTGTWIAAERLESFVSSVPDNALVIVDEAYAEYLDDPAYPDTVSWLDRYPNLVVTRTFSKAFGLAGLRVGYAVSHPDVADLLNRVRQPFNVGTLGQVAALAALDDEAHLARSVAMNSGQRERLTAACAGWGLTVIPSACNFVLVDMGRPAEPIFEALLRAGVIVRPVANYGLPNHLRMSVGTPEETGRLIEALDPILSGA